MGMVMQWNVVSEAELTRVQSMEEDDFFGWLDDVEERTSFDVDKAWHGVHGVLTGSATDIGGLGQAVFGGIPFGSDLGYGQPRALAAGEVRWIADALEAIDVDRFRSLVDLPALHRLAVYPSIWDRESERDELIDFLVDGYATIRQGFTEAAAAEMCMIISCL